eukprot:3527039-Amphidinium_carterae.1
MEAMPWIGCGGLAGPLLVGSEAMHNSAQGNLFLRACRSHGVACNLDGVLLHVNTTCTCCSGGGAHDGYTAFG